MIITDKLEVTEQCAKASKKANAMLGMINRAKEVVVQLYRSIVRPYLDYRIQASIQTKIHKLLESVQ